MYKPSYQMEPSPAAGLALVLENACNEFESLQKVIRGEVAVISPQGMEEIKTIATIQMALAKSFVFNVVRARRICEHGAGRLKLDRDQRLEFLKNTSGVLGVRDVNEHGFDVQGGRRGKYSKPRLHRHHDKGVSLDETSVVVRNDTMILMGPINIHDIYLATDIMRGLAGYRSLYERDV